MADPEVVTKKAIAAALAEQLRQSRDVEESAEVNAQVNVNPDTGHGSGSSGSNPVFPTWVDNLVPLSHSSGCRFSEDKFQEQLKEVLWTPKKLEVQLSNENRKHVEDGKKQGRKYRPIYKKPTQEIANDPVVLAYLKDQRDLVTVHRQEFYNFCDCKLDGQTRKRTPKTVFPSDLERQRVQGTETLPDLFLEKRVQAPVVPAGSSPGLRSTEVVGKVVEQVDRMTRVSTRAAAANAAALNKGQSQGQDVVEGQQQQDHHLLVKTNAEITEMDVCMAMGPYNQMDLFPIVIGGQLLPPSLGGVAVAVKSSAVTTTPPSTLTVAEACSTSDSKMSQETMNDVLSSAVQPGQGQLECQQPQPSPQPQNPYEGLNLSLSESEEDGTTESEGENENPGRNMPLIN